jgi:hypothetical protein
MTVIQLVASDVAEAVTAARDAALIDRDAGAPADWGQRAAAASACRQGKSRPTAKGALTDLLIPAR